MILQRDTVELTVLFIPPPLEGGVGSEWSLKRSVRGVEGQDSTDQWTLPPKQSSVEPSAG